MFLFIVSLGGINTPTQARSELATDALSELEIG